MVERSIKNSLIIFSCTASILSGCNLILDFDIPSDDSDGDGVFDSTKREAQATLTGATVDELLFQGADSVDLFLSGKALRDLLEDLAANGAI